MGIDKKETRQNNFAHIAFIARGMAILDWPDELKKEFLDIAHAFDKKLKELRNRNNS